ncbi:hypothetical protein E8L99_21780 [Phreatobacter aquaticus]|uniref:Uncharacterized protein n=1 Tax=Phreatobacter aquaticus TaxID=2570229 RepID=A0A4D7QRV5_9HYPH|nr:hypothetical protein [Phreatobacter aquaticus]QCK88199.1 hypothetical protein E8L99_21780 [Phreatobacter aquaticus]
MYIQHCAKGIAGSHNGVGGITWNSAKSILTSGDGILSNWWIKMGSITPKMIENVLTESNLDSHLHDYNNFGNDTPFISLACGAVERDTLLQSNFAYSAIDTALMFATDNWNRPGAVFYCWVPTSHYKAVPISAVAEPVRDLNIYQRWSPYQLEGEITAKINIPSNQIERVEWWDASISTTDPHHTFHNTKYIEPKILSNLRDMF